jgi:hypothetical protein
VSVREAVWQTYISRAGSDAAEALEARAAGMSLSQVLRTYRDQIRPEVFERFEGHCRWHFMQQQVRPIAAPVAAAAI